MQQAESKADPTPRSEFLEERVLLTIRPAMFRGKPILFTAHAIAILAAGVGVIWAAFFASIMWLAILIGAVGLVVLLNLLYWRIKAWSIVLKVTNERTVEDRGFFSRVTSEVMHHNIRNVQITQSFWNRIWNVGKIQIASAGHEGYEITFHDVVDPYKVKSTIDEHRDYGEGD